MRLALAPCLIALSMGMTFAATTFDWAFTGELAIARGRHTANLLGDGRVLVTGGVVEDPSNSVTDTAELYDPASGTWTNTGNMTQRRQYHTATTLADGTVLVAGGFGPDDTLANAELYQPSSEVFVPTGSMTTPRTRHTATLLPDGRVLVAGGISTNSPLKSAELYDPSTGLWTATGNMIQSRTTAAAVLLADGKVLVLGGNGPGIGTPWLKTAEIYDPATGVWTATGKMEEARYDVQAILLRDGRVLTAGGKSGNALSECELYDPVTEQWSVTGAMTDPRAGHTLTALRNGQVIATGGFFVTGSSLSLATTDLYNPRTGVWTAGGNMEKGRSEHTGTLLPSGQVLVVGGFEGGFRGSVARAELGMRVRGAGQQGMTSQ